MTTDPDLPSALAEGRWLWRRLFVFMTAGGLHLALGRVLDRLDPAAAARAAEGLMALMGLTLVLYLVAPTAQQLASLAARLKLGGGR